MAVFAGATMDVWSMLFGIWYAGLIAVPLNTNISHGRLVRILRDADAKLLMSSDPGHRAEEMADMGIPPVDILQEIHGDGFPRQISKGQEAGYVSDCAPNDVALLYYYRSRTGAFQAAVVTHRNLLLMVLGYLSEILRLDHGESVTHINTSNHPVGMVTLAHIARATNNIFVELDNLSLNSKTFVSLAGGSVAVATTFKGLQAACENGEQLKDAMRGLRRFIYTRDGATGEALEHAVGVFGDRLVQIYGEGPTILSLTSLSGSDHLSALNRGQSERFWSVGLPRLPVEIEVRDIEGHVMPVGMYGNVFARGDLLPMIYRNPNQGEDETINDGWLPTGDVGAFSEEGFLYVSETATGRLQQSLGCGGDAEPDSFAM